tara:strand:- start:8 stop:211 length:204 start_codon:yes stop_codon:yes gene_type:complete
VVVTYYERIDKGLIEDPYPPIDEKAIEEMINSNLVEITNNKKSKQTNIQQILNSDKKVGTLGDLMKN